MKFKFEDFKRVARPGKDGNMRINPSNVYILPTSFGLAYTVLLILLLIGSINYSNNLGFLLTFFLAAIALITMVHTWRNIAGLSIKSIRLDPVFSGHTANFTFSVVNPDRYRPDIELIHGDHSIDAIDAGPHQTNNLNLQLMMRRRGYFHLHECMVRSRYPLALFRAWAYIYPDQKCLVYPNPISWPHIKSGDTESETQDGQFRKDSTGIDFHGLREYLPGDPIKTIHWKSYAKGHGLMTREFETFASNDFWLTWDSVPGPDQETKIGQLCFATTESAVQNLRFGLRLPGIVIEPNQGTHHLNECLKTLALFGLKS